MVDQAHDIADPCETLVESPLLPHPDAATNYTDDTSALTSLLEVARILDNVPSGLVDKQSDLALVMDTIVDSTDSPPSLFIDLEGTNLSRHGSISILQLHVATQNKTYLIDVETLQKQAFETCGSKGQSLKAILESETVLKVFYDVRNDSDALYSHYKINLAGVEDIQLMELATRNYSRKYVKGLAKCVEVDLPLTIAERKVWKDAKEQGLGLFAPERGGSYEVFRMRPLPQAIVQYCIQDVQFLPKLWHLYHSKLTNSWTTRVEKATRERISQSQSEHYIGQGRQKALGPW